MEPERGFQQSVAQLGSPLLGALDRIEQARRKLHPPDLAAIREALEPVRARLDEALATFRVTPVPDELEPFALQLTAAAENACEALRLFVEPFSASEGVRQIVAGMHFHCRAQDALYPLRHVLPPVGRFFLEPAFHSRLAELDPDTPAEGVSVGLHRAGEKPPARLGFSLYVPESYDGKAAWPLVVALHGGSGAGADFLWTWLTFARGRRFLLLAPTSAGPTWSMMGPDIDAAAIRSMVEYVQSNWRVDPERVLLTGLSDGATYSLLLGLSEDSPFTALAPVSGVLHPASFANGNLQRAAGRRIYLVHGALDWLFPVELARAAHEELLRAGADVIYREIADLSHTYPREENDRILEWFDPSLALPRAPGGVD